MDSVEIARLANELNSVAAQLKVARQDLERAKTRIEASERSLLVIQKGIFAQLNKK